MKQSAFAFLDSLQEQLNETLADAQSMRESVRRIVAEEYNEARPHQGRWCFGKTPMQTFLDAMPMTKEKMIAA
jgi:hypothetical protein